MNMAGRPEHLDIVYVAALPPYGTCFHRAQALVRLGHTVMPVPTLYPREATLASISRRALKRMLGPRDDMGANRRLLAYVRDYHPHVVWIDKGLTIDAETLCAIRKRSPATLLVHYSPDDMSNPENHSRQYFQCIPIYDLHVTTKSFLPRELTPLGAKRVLFVNNAHCPVIHRPVAVTPRDREEVGGPVGFIGAREAERRASIVALGRRGISVRVWGRWNIPSTGNVRIERGWLYNGDYARAICAFDINLGFLRKENRDVQTTRSVEVPACGGFMLAERTDEHLSLFEEDREAVFFGNDEELVDKAIYYLGHPDERARIAAAGRQRCLASRYDNDAMVGKVLDHLFEQAPPA